MEHGDLQEGAEVSFIYTAGLQCSILKHRTNLESDYMHRGDALIGASTLYPPAILCRLSAPSINRNL